MRQIDAYAEAAYIGAMTRLQYLAAIRKLGLSQVRAGRVLGLSPRQSQRLASGDSPIPEPAARLLRLIIRLELNPEDIV